MSMGFIDVSFDMRYQTGEWLRIVKNAIKSCFIFAINKMEIHYLPTNGHFIIKQVKKSETRPRLLIAVHN